MSALLFVLVEMIYFYNVNMKCKHLGVVLLQYKACNVNGFIYYRQIELI